MGLLQRNSLVAHALDTTPTTRGVDQRSRLLALLSVAVKICYASSILFEFSKEYLTRKFLTALCEESGDGFIRHWRKGGETQVKYFKITKTWSVKAESETEAIKLVVAEPDKYLETETVTRTEYKKPKQTGGWGTAVKDQLLGTNGKR